MMEMTSPIRAPAELSLGATFEDVDDLCQWESRLRWRVEEEEGITLSLSITNGTIHEVYAQSRRRRGEIIDRANRLASKGTAHVGGDSFIHLNEWLTRDIIRQHITDFFLRRELEARKLLAIEEAEQRKILAQLKAIAAEQAIRDAKIQREKDNKNYVARVRQKLQNAVRGIALFKAAASGKKPRRNVNELSLSSLEKRRHNLDALVQGRCLDNRRRRLLNELQEGESAGREALLAGEAAGQEELQCAKEADAQERRLAVERALRRKEVGRKAEEARRERDRARERERGPGPDREDLGHLKQHLKTLLQRGEVHKQSTSVEEALDHTPPRLKGPCAALRVLADVSEPGLEDLRAVVDNCTLRPA